MSEKRSPNCADDACVHGARACRGCAAYSKGSHSQAGLCRKALNRQSMAGALVGPQKGRAALPDFTQFGDSTLGQLP